MYYYLLMKTHQAAFGIFRNQNHLDRAIQILQEHGMRRAGILVLHPDRPGQKAFAYEYQTMIRAGALLGGAMGLCIGLMVGAAAFPESGFMLGLGFMGALFGAASGALVGIGTPESAVQRYMKYLEDGGTLLSVHVRDPKQAGEAIEVLETAGAEDITLGNELSRWRTLFLNKRKLLPGLMSTALNDNRSR